MRTRFIAASLAAALCTASFTGISVAKAENTCTTGDLNGNGTLDCPDILILQKYILGAEKLTLESAVSADINGDGKVNVFDMIDWREQYSETSAVTTDLSGTFVTDSGAVVRIAGDCGNDGASQFSVSCKGEDVTFAYPDGVKKSGAVSFSDKNHFSVKWSDGSTENFTRREIKIIQGITYINNILIANKSYSLPETYNPGALTADTQAAFEKMQAAAAKDGIKLWICSGFRSYSYQAQLYNGYASRGGYAKADTYSARPGHSEHQTGMAMDICYAASWFDNTPETIWLAKNCYDYGFILRYPKGKENITGYMYEPWHIRYVGLENAQLIHDSGLTLEEYLGIDSYYH